MKEIDVNNQVSLSFGKCVELVFSGLKYRLFRAAVTVVIISLAVAFLMTMLTESFAARRVANEIHAKTAPRRIFDFWVSRISAPMSEQNLVSQLAKASKDGPRWSEFQAWGQLDDQQLNRLVRLAKDQMTYQRFFGRLNDGQLRPMFGRVRGPEIFRYLQDKKAYQQFRGEFYTLGLKMPTTLDQFKKFLAEWISTEDMRKAILNGNRKALAAVQAQLGGRNVKSVLASVDERLIKLLADNHFRIDPAQIAIIRNQAQLSVDADRLSRLLHIGLVKNRLADRRNVELAKVDTPMYFSELSSRSGAKWLREQVADLANTIRRLETSLPKHTAELARMEKNASAMDANILKLQAISDELDKALTQAQAAAGKKTDPASKAAVKQAELAAMAAKNNLQAAKKKYQALDDLRLLVKRESETASSLMPARANIETFDLTTERIRQVARSRLEERKLDAIEASVSRQAGNEDGLFGYSSRTMWLIAVSFLVCVVGIANAMLMSVTDRFREIATMKCLGATDGYIMTNFIMESCLQGTAGGILGVMLGFVLGSLRSLTNYGWMAIQHLPWTLIGVTALVALVVGVILSAMAAVYPAWIAARLAPMEAMRIE